MAAPAPNQGGLGNRQGAKRRPRPLLLVDSSHPELSRPDNNAEEDFLTPIPGGLSRRIRSSSMSKPTQVPPSQVTPMDNLEEEDPLDNGLEIGIGGDEMMRSLFDESAPSVLPDATATPNNVEMEESINFGEDWISMYHAASQAQAGYFDATGNLQDLNVSESTSSPLRMTARPTTRTLFPTTPTAAGGIQGSVTPGYPVLSFMAPPARSPEKVADDLFEEFINPDAYELFEDAPQQIVTPRKSGAGKSASFVEPPTPELSDPKISSLEETNLENQHTYPKIIDAHSGKPRSRSQLDKIRRETDPEFRNDETWGDDYYFSEQPRPIPPASENADAFKTEDHVTTFRALREAAKAKAPIPDYKTVTKHSFSQGLRDIYGPDAQEQAKKQAKEEKYLRDVRKNFKSTGAFVQDIQQTGQPLEEEQLRGLNMQSTLLDSGTMLDDPDFASFCQSATFLPGRAGPPPPRDDPAAVLAYAQKPRNKR